MDRMVFDKLNYGLYVVGVFEGGRNYGCLISSFFQITSGSPQKCAIVLNRDNRTCAERFRLSLQPCGGQVCGTACAAGRLWQSLSYRQNCRMGQLEGDGNNPCQELLSVYLRRCGRTNTQQRAADDNG